METFIVFLTEGLVGSALALLPVLAVIAFEYYFFREDDDDERATPASEHLTTSVYERVAHAITDDHHE